MKKSKLKYGLLNNIFFILKDMLSEYPLLIVYIILQSILTIIYSVLGTYLPKISIDLVVNSADTYTVLFVLGGFTLIMAIILALSHMSNNGKYMMYNCMRSYYMRKIYLHSLDCDYINIESTKGQTKYRRAMECVTAGDGSGTSTLTIAMIEMFVAIISFIIYSSIISTLNIFIVLLLIVLSSINFFAVKSAQKYEYKFKDDQSKLIKKLNYIEYATSDIKSGKDIRLYNMTGWFLSLRETILNMYAALYNKVMARYFFAGTINALTLLLRDSIAYGYLIWSVSSNSISIGDFVLYFGAITGFSSYVSDIVKNATELNAANLKINDLRNFTNSTNEKDPANPVDIKDLLNKPLSIEFKNVYFSYDEDVVSSYVLKDFNLKIDSGEKVALVGVNGAGKTTIVKLLCGLYPPNSGDILINNINISQYRKKDLFTLFATVFQDIFIAPFSMAENVSMVPKSETDMNRVLECLNKVGLSSVVNNCEDGINSCMTKAVEDGVVLSGGQNQKLLMARALYKDAPILILDEPTAALDPIAESETYESFHELAKDKTSIYISHRLASTRFCDRIIFLQNGVILESGTHEALLNLNGEYANMFSIQSHYYKKENGGEDYAN